MQQQKQYQVLWIDDKHEGMPGFKMQAFQNGIKISAYRSRQLGIAEIRSRYKFYDAVILDALFFETEDDTESSEDLSALVNAKNDLLQLPKKVPFFVLTGQKQLVADKTFNSFVPQYFRKGIAEDIQALFLAIKEAADGQEDTQIRHDFPAVFKACTEQYIGVECAKTILQAIKNTKKLQTLDNSEDLFTPIRKIVEKLFAAFNKMGILPDEVFNDKGWMNGSRRFLAGEHNAYTYKGPILHPTIAFLLENILLVLQDASHIEGSLQLKVDNHIKELNTPYLYIGTVYQLLDVVVWFKKFKDENPDINNIKGIWERKVFTLVDSEWIKGTISRIAPNGFGTFLPDNGGKTFSILPNMVAEYELKETQAVEVTTKLDTTGTKTFIKEIRTIPHGI